jgi:hypothetical protein
LTDADRFFNEILKGLRPLLALSGFRRFGQNFVLESPDCWGIINFQKSRWSEPEEKTFYVNLAVTAKRLLLFQHERTDKAPAYWKCAWRNRAEFFGPQPGIQQWTVRDEASALETLEYLRVLICEFAVPKLKSALSEAALLQMWADDTRLGYPILKAKSVLLATQAKAEDLGRTLRRLQNEFGSGAVAEGVASHIAALRREFPETMRRVQL